MSQNVIAPPIQWPEGGRVAGIVQDRGDGRVLMLGWLDREALAATLATGLVHFHSRSRDRLWRKGETSGNELRLVEMSTDCDGDALLLTVEATGPTCHTGSRSCFDPAGEMQSGRPAAQDFAWLETLWSTIEDRARQRPTGSYTASLIEGGVDAVSRKVAEEATEVVLAAKDRDADDSPESRAALVGEVADLLFHTLVLCAERGVPPSEVIAVLRDRHRG